MKERGSAIVETAMFVPLLIILLVGMSEIARITYVYHTLQKTMYNLARLVSTRQGANLCDSGDSQVVMAKNWAISGSSDGGEPILAGLTSDMIQIRVERTGAGGEDLGECECSLTGCDIASGGRGPDFVVVSMPEGFPVRVTLPYLMQEVILFRPSVRVPYGGS